MAVPPVPPANGSTPKGAIAAPKKMPARSDPSSPKDNPESKSRRFRYHAEDWLCLLAVYVAFFILFEPKLYRPGIVFDGNANAQIAEAQAWWQGRLDVPKRWLDTAVYDGKFYSHFPLLFTIISAAVVPFFGGVPHWILVLLALPVPLLCFELCRRVSGSPQWGAVLGVGLLSGTSLWPVLKKVVIGASPYHVNHVLATMALLAFLIEWFGRRRVWACGLTLLLATLARQLTIGLALPLVWLAWREGDPAGRFRRMGIVALFLTLAVGVPLLANTLKFDRPWNSGYMLIYEGRTDDMFARDARAHGLFSPYFLPRNLYYMNAGFPNLYRIESEGRPQWLLKPNQMGTGIWWTTPVLLFLLVGIRRILRDPPRRMLLGGALLTIAALLLFHATGAYQRGYNRFSLDYVPVLFALAIPAATRSGWRWLTPVLVVWSVLYFRFIMQWPFVRIL
ncbi:MAG: hypothetical protein J5J06_11770 [Phycisphaerae bacterium]|nr:hypothetical protein [Phycisphaerae bacterium]